MRGPNGKGTVWRRDAGRPDPAAKADPEDGLDRAALWDTLTRLDAPIAVVLGSSFPAVTGEDIDTLLDRRPDATVIEVDGAGHEVQRDRPDALAETLDRLVPGA